MNSQTAKRKKAEGGSLQQPQMDGDYRAASPATQQDEFTSGGTSLQEKMVQAAKALEAQVHEALHLDFELEDVDHPFRTYIFDRLSPYLHFTPRAALYRLGHEWIRLSEETLATAVNFTSDPKEFLKDMRKAAKRAGTVGWTLPKLKGGAPQ
jgi:hypothetical protein